MTGSLAAPPNLLPAEARAVDGAWKAWIDGAWRDGAGRLEVTDPADGSTVAHVAVAGSEQVDEAVAAAVRAFESGPWPRTSPQSRASALLRLADGLRRHGEELAVLDSRCNGMLLREAVAMARRCAASVEYSAGLPQRAYGQTIPVSPRYVDFTMREPVGVCALILPWNGPLIQAVWKMAPAIALGNTVVIKPSELTPLSALVLARIVDEAGVPPGVVNVVCGAGDVGAALVAHPGVDKIAFTGSTATGKRIMAAAADRIARVTLELGGKSPTVFFDDVDPAEAVAGAVTALMRNCGQTCIAGSRILVQRRLYEEFVERAVAAVGTLRVGRSSDERTQIGPIVSAAQLAKVQGYVRSATVAGAQVHGAQRLDHDPFAAGTFMAPGLITGADHQLPVSREEIFGPVGVVLPFDDEDEAVAIANDTSYGLAAGIWTTDGKRALRVARRIRAGTVWVNTYGWNFTEAPMGGFKQSGLGRENGDSAIAHYTEVKNVVLDTRADQPLDQFGLLR
ncbi:aldehyde dehydrogenase family protein [Pseudonocardia thermophila]|uniref:aldehyde dehydrogenase family protein n=1 Tax=Pseudonocardia thermophila TaxID=1848 RepID=UPI00248EBB94|nr:aldehyde dehydrogenase family protein [Pseudonocardia thermophila]